MARGQLVFEICVTKVEVENRGTPRSRIFTIRFGDEVISDPLSNWVYVLFMPIANCALPGGRGCRAELLKYLSRPFMDDARP
jgi:hypothetical protein